MNMSNPPLTIAMDDIVVSTEHQLSSPNVPGERHIKPADPSNDANGQEPEFTYPEGGLAAWTVATGCWCSMTAGLGLINSVGVLEAYVSTTMLPSSSSNAIGWMFGIYVFVSYFCGVQIGPIFDVRGPRELMIVGSICSVVGIFTLSLCTGWYI
jgi:hypothetical protein